MTTEPILTLYLIILHIFQLLTQYKKTRIKTTHTSVCTAIILSTRETTVKQFITVCYLGILYNIKMFGIDLLPLYLEDPRPGRDWWRKPCCCMYVPWAARLNQMLIVWQSHRPRDAELMLYKVTRSPITLWFFFFRFYRFESIHALQTVIFQNMLEMFSY